MTGDDVKIMGDWSTTEQITRDFAEERWDENYQRTTAPLDLGGTVLLAGYWDEDYNGTAYVLIRRSDGTLADCEGSHCSCYGLEGQWKPTPTTAEGLLLQYRQAVSAKLDDSDYCDARQRCFTSMTEEEFLAVLKGGEPCEGRR